MRVYHAAGHAFVAAAVLSAAMVLSPAAARSQPSNAELELAKRHFELGRTYYDQAAYEKALRAFQEAYNLSQKPALLFNIGKCHESMGQLQSAIDHYDRYLKATGKTDGNLEARIKNLRRRLEASRPKPTPPPKDSKAPDDGAAAAGSPDRGSTKDAGAAAAPVGAGDDRPSRWMKWAGWGLVGTGAAALVTSVVMAVFAKRKSDAVERYWNDANRDWVEVKKFEDQGTGFELGQIVSLVAGIAAAGGGVTLLLLAPNRPRSASAPSPLRVELAPTLAPGTVGIGLSGAFSL